MSGVEGVKPVDLADLRPQVVGNGFGREIEGTDGALRRRRAISRPLLFDVVVVAVYVVLGLVAFAPNWPWTSTRLFGTKTGADAVLCTWFLAWVPHALAHGINPLFSNALYAPLGVNVAQNTATPLLGVLTGLVAPVLSPVARGNLVTVMALPVSASAAYVVLRKWEVWSPAAAIGGLVYGFSPFMLQPADGHPFLVFLPLPPFIALTLVSIVRRTGSPRRLGLELGLLLAAQFLIAPEIFVMCIILSALVLITVGLRQRAQVVERCRNMLRPLATAAVVTALLIVIPAWMYEFGPRHFTGPVHPISGPYYNDLLSFIHPGPPQRLSLGIPPLHGLPAASQGYIGIPFLIVAIGLAWRSRHTSRMQVALLLTVWAYILSLGTHLSIEGHLSKIPMPFDVVVRLPLFDNILPSRFSFATGLGLGAVTAFGLDDLRDPARPVLGGRHLALPSVSSAGRRGSVACAVVLAALVVSQLPRWPYESQPIRELPAQIRVALPQGNPVAVTYPYPSSMNAEAEVWQMQDGFSFRLIGGYALQPAANGRASLAPNPTSPPDLALYLENLESHINKPPTERLVTATRAALANDDVRLVVVDQAARGGALALTLFERALGGPKVRSGSFALWSTSQRAL